MAIDIKTKEVNTIPVIGKYTVLVIKSVSVLLQNIPKNKKDCTGLFQSIPIGIAVSAGTIKKS